MVGFIFANQIINVNNSNTNLELEQVNQEILKGNLDVYDQGVTDGEFRNKIEEEDIINLFRERQVLEPGKDAVRDVGLWIEEVVSAQLATLPVDPYSGEEIPEEYQAVLDTVDLVFPFTIKGFNDADAPYTQLQEDLFTYEMFQGYMQDPPVRVVLPEGGETELKEEEIDEYKRALNEYMVEELWVEDKHFYWADLKYEQVKKWLIKGMWYFDKKYSELIYRPIALAPVTTAIEIFEGEDDDIDTGF